MSTATLPAFPHIDTRHGSMPDGGQVFFGLTKREYFAGLAMQGLLANPGGPIQANASNGWSLTNCTREQVAGAALRFADALLSELAKQP